ncbi:MAG: DUF4212 domain-containing protein [Bacteroidales bacterium]|nr:DUF4212 domain-containing protein [Bacteroidales bacterium]
MNTNNEDYKVSFFRPTNDHSRENRNMVLWLVIIWAVAVFGFQTALRIIQEPTPEPALTDYYEVKHVVLSDEYVSVEQRQMFIKSISSVLGKAFLRDLGLNKVNKLNYPMLRNVLGWAVYQAIPDSVQPEVKNVFVSYEKTQLDLETLQKNQNLPEKRLLQYEFERELKIKEQAIIQEKAKVKVVLEPFMATLVGQDPMAGMIQNVIYAQVKPGYLEGLPQEYLSNLDDVMNFYLVHNRSVLTDTKFLGFPFHYFYSAVFLLVLFVFLCWVYAWRTEKINKKYGVVD